MSTSINQTPDELIPLVPYSSNEDTPQSCCLLLKNDEEFEIKSVTPEGTPKTVGPILACVYWFLGTFK